MSVGLYHTSIGGVLTQSEYHADGSHTLDSGTSFPGGAGAMDLFYRTDEDKWYMYTTTWTDLTGGADFSSIGESLIPDTPDTYNIGSAAAEWNNLYLGTGRLFFYTDQAESIRSSGSAMILTVNSYDTSVFGGDGTYGYLTLYGNASTVPYIAAVVNSTNIGVIRFYESSKIFAIATPNAAGAWVDRFNIPGWADDVSISIQDAHFIPTDADSYNLGSVDNEWNNLYIGTGRIYLYTDQGESIRSDGTNIIFDVATTAELALNVDNLRPYTDEGLTLGHSSYSYGGLYLRGATVITMAGTVANAAGAANPQITFNEDSSSSYYILAKRGTTYSSEEDDLILSYFDGGSWNSIYRWDASANELIVGGQSGDVIVPYSDGLVDLGTTSVRYGTIYGDNITITNPPWAGVDGTTSQWFPASDPNGNKGDHPSILMADGIETIVRQSFILPESANSVTEAYAVIIADASGNLDWEVTTDFGQIVVAGGSNEAYNLNSDTASGTTAVTSGDIEGIDISAALTGITVEDLVGIEFKRDGDDASDTIGDTVHFIGIWIKGA